MKRAAIVSIFLVLSWVVAMSISGCAGTGNKVLKTQQPAAEKQSGLTWESVIDPFSFIDEAQWSLENMEEYEDNVVAYFKRTIGAQPTHAFVLMSTGGYILSYCYIIDGEFFYYALNMPKMGYFLFELPESDAIMLKDRLLIFTEYKEPLKGI